MNDGKTRPGGVIDERFVLKRRLGGGGAATVWRATDLTTRKDVALKLLHPRYRGIDEAHERLAREAALLAGFTHPNIARAYAFELDRATPYFVMGLIEGESLEDELGARSTVDDHFPWSELLRLVGQICSAVDYAHGHGVLHRDLKPSNIMLDTRTDPPSIQILDFGIAKLLGSTSRHPTTQGRVMGTGFYMAPEQARGEAVDHRADLFALGVVVFEMLTLRRAWVRNDRGGPVRAFAEAARRNEFNTPGAILSRIAHETRPRPSAFRPNLPGALDAPLAWALAIEPDDRPPNASAILTELQAATNLLPEGVRAGSGLKAPTAAASPVQATWSREEEPPSDLELDLSMRTSTVEASMERPRVRVGGAAAADWADQGTVADQGTAADRSKVSDRGAIDESAATKATRGSRRANPVSASVEPISAEGPADGPTKLVLEPTEVVVDEPPARASASFADVPVGLKVAVVVVGGLTVAALLVLAGYQLGRRNPAPTVRRVAPMTPERSTVNRPSVVPARRRAGEVAVPSAASITPPPAPAPEPERRPAEVPRRRRASRVNRRTESNPSLAALRRMVASARAAPDDLTLLARTGRAIEENAQRISNPTARARVQRMARSSVMLGDIEGIDEAFRALEGALQ